MQFLVHLHSGLRWIALLLLILAIVNAFLSIKRGEYLKKDKMINLFAMITMHTQLLIGFILLFTSGKVSFSGNWMGNNIYRFFGMEHILGMLIAIVLITIGRKKAESEKNIVKKHKKIVVWYTIALLIVIASIPWPFRGLGSALY